MPADLVHLCEIAAFVSEVPTALVCVWDEGGHRVVASAGSGARQDGGRGIAGFAARVMSGIADGTNAVCWMDSAGGERPAAGSNGWGPAGMRFFAGWPLVSGGGVAIGALCLVDDRPRSEGLAAGRGAMLASLARVVAGELDRSRHDRRSAEVAVASSIAIDNLNQQFAVLADAIPQLVWSAGADGTADWFNRVWHDFTGCGHADSIGAGWLGCVHPEDRERVRERWSAAAARGADYAVEFRLRRHDGAWRWMLARGQALRNRDGVVTGWLGTCTDIDETRVLAERSDIVSRELSHRIGNIFAVVGGLIGLTVRERPAFAAVGAELQARVLALGRAHDFVRPQSERSRRPLPHTSLIGMLGELLAPYGERGGSSSRIVIEGEDVTIDDRSATPLALAFHELATNAAKYGALSVPAGEVRIAIASRDETVEFDWRERGGPPVATEAEAGFGTRLIEFSLVRQLNGRIAFDRAADGLRFHAAVPRATMARDTALA